jgi:hypothetical protein
MTLARHPANPDRPYMPWTQKVKMKLEELRQIQNPDIRTKGEVAELEAKLGWNRNYRRKK